MLTDINILIFYTKTFGDLKQTHYLCTRFKELSDTAKVKAETVKRTTKAIGRLAQLV